MPGINGVILFCVLSKKTLVGDHGPTGITEILTEGGEDVSSIAARFCEPRSLRQIIAKLKMMDDHTIGIESKRTALVFDSEGDQLPKTLRQSIRDRFAEIRRYERAVRKRIYRKNCRQRQ
jgi:hypothetical protein